jgi:hypothetical protein
MNVIYRIAIVLLGVICFALPALAADEPFYDGLGTTTRQVTAANPEAQKYVAQGIQFLYGFSHGAAIRSFEQAIKLDPTCAMAYWGIAYANGPHVNFPLVPLAQTVAYVNFDILGSDLRLDRGTFGTLADDDSADVEPRGRQTLECRDEVTLRLDGPQGPDGPKHDARGRPSAQFKRANRPACGSRTCRPAATGCATTLLPVSTS